MTNRGLILLLLVAFSGCKSASPNFLYDGATDLRAEGRIELEIETEDVTLPRPVEQLMSVTHKTPIFSAGGGSISSLRYSKNNDPIVQAIRSLPAELSSSLVIEHGGNTTITLRQPWAANSGAIHPGEFLPLHGVCINGVTFALGHERVVGTAPDNYDIKVLAFMARAYRPDIKGCRARFSELVDVKFKEKLKVEKKLEVVEALNITFNFIPGYSGAESAFINGNAYAGTAEIIADVATAGIATKYKAGWKALRLSRAMHRSINNGFMVSAVGANMVRLGTLFGEVQQRGAQVSDLPTVVLLVAETGFVLAHVKVKFTRKAPGLSGFDVGQDVSQSVKRLSSFFDRKVQRITAVNMINDAVSQQQLGAITKAIGSEGKESILIVAYENNVDPLINGLIHWMTVHVKKNGSWVARHAGATDFYNSQPIISQVDSLRHGIVMKPKMSDSEIQDAVKNFYAQSKSRISCVQDACSAIQIQKPNQSPVFVRNNLNKLMEDGLTLNGRQLQFDYFKLSEANNTQIAMQMLGTDIKAPAALGFIAAAFSVATGTVKELLFGAIPDSLGDRSSDRASETSSADE